MKKNNLGFSLVELITVIILIAILAVSVVPKFTGSDSFEAYTYRTQLVSDLRLLQQRAMQQTALPYASANSYCHQMVFDTLPTQYGTPDRLDCTVTAFPNGWQPDEAGLVVDSQHDISFTIAGSASANLISFDGMGRPNCSSSCIITITSAVESVQIEIESEGYIHVI